MCTSISENSNLGYLFSVYPNPTEKNFRLVSETNTSIKIINELGQVIQIIQLNENNNFTADVFNLEAGVYFLTCEKGTKKIVVLK
jgi:hypothetical protein